MEFRTTKKSSQGVSEWHWGKLQIEAAEKQDRRFRVKEDVTRFSSLPLDLIDLEVILES